MRWLRYIFDFFWISTFLLLMLLGTLWFAFQFPAIQTLAVKKATDYLSLKLGQPTSIGRVNVKWFDALSLEEVLIKDIEGREMIKVGRLDLDHDFWALITNKDTTNRPLHLNAASLYKPEVVLIVNPKTGNLNLDDFIANIEKLVASPNNTSDPNNNTPFFIDQIAIIDGLFRWDDPTKPLMRGKAFDYNHFTLKNINAQTKNFMVLGDSLSLDIKNLSVIDKSTGLTIKDLDTKFLFCGTKIELGRLYARIGNSVIKNYLSFNYVKPSDMGHWNDKVLIKGRFDSTKIESADLGFFAAYLTTLNETWRVSGEFEGTVQDFKLKKTDLAFGKNSRIRGDIAFKNIVNFSKAQMDFDLKNTRFSVEDLRQYYPDKSFNELMQRFGEVEFTGKYKGTIDNINVQKADFVSSTLGRVKGDLQLDLRSKIPTYTADIQTEGFDLGKVLDDPTFKLTDFNGKIKGRGFSLKDATLDVDNWVKRFSYNNYVYHNIHLKGNLQNKFFEGLVTVADSNLKARLEGAFDFSGNKYKYHARGKIDRANLLALNLTKDSLKIHTDLDVDLEGNTIDEIVGQAKFYNSYASLSKRNIVVDTLLINSDLYAGERKLAINSEFLNFKANGQFKPTKAIADLRQLLNEYQLYFFDNEVNRSVYYNKKRLTKITKRYSIDYNIGFKKMAKLLAFLYPDGYVSPNAKAEGRFVIDNTSIFSLSCQFDTLKLGKNEFYQSEIDINSSKFTNNPEVLASIIVASDKQQFAGLLPTEKMDLDLSWDIDHIDFQSSLRQQNNTNRASLNGHLRFVGDQIQIQFEKSKLKLLDENWNLAANNLTTIDGSNFSFSNLRLAGKDGSILLNGDVSEDSTQILRLETENFKLSTLNPVLNTNLQGTVNGVVLMRDLYKNPIYESDLTVDKLTYNDFLMGNVAGKADWDGYEKHLHLNAGLTRDNKKVVNLTGIYDPKLKDRELDLVAQFDNTNLNLVQPFAKGLVSDLSGQLVGNVSIKGGFSNPTFDGFVDVKKGKLTFDYLKAVFAFEDKIYFDDENIRVKKMRLTDPEGNIATLDGGVFYGGGNNFSLGFTGRVNNFKVLNTTARDNDLYYGTAYATGKVDVFGPIDNLQVTTNLRNNKGTKIFIPLNSVSETVTDDYVQFISTAKIDTATTIAAVVPKPTETSGIKLDLHFDITPDAECQVKIGGDAIRAFGTGALDFKIDTKGLFTMNGSYEINRGDYLFSFQGLANKNFKIQEGSKVAWTGDPYSALLDVKASYTQYTSLAPILPTGVASSGSIRQDVLTRRYPVEVVIAASDKILTPNIHLDMKFKDYPSDFQIYIPAVEANFKRDEQALNRQVVSLLVFNQLVPESADFVAQSVNTGAAWGSVSELVTNQFNKLASSLDENLEIGVSGFDFSRLNSSTASSNIWNDLQLRFSYRFLNDRFRITRDGRLSYGQGQSDATATNLLSDWTLEYWITPDGTKRMKMYSRNTQNQFSLNTATVSYGASYTVSKSFNTLFKAKETTRLNLPPKVEANKITSVE